jgi:Predicted permeases
MDLEWGMVILVLLGGLGSGFMNSIVGGGGMISLPIFLMLGLPAATALGSNKISSVLGAIASSIAFIRSGHVNVHLMKRYVPMSFLGSVLGVFVTQLLSSEFLRTLVVVLLFAVCLLTMFKRDWGSYSTYRPLTGVLFFGGAMAAFALGFYDGFFGPGTGTFLIFCFLVIGCSFVESAANAQILNCTSNIAAALTFIYFGQVSWSYALLMGAAQIVGSLIGTRMAILKGAAWVRPIFIVVSLILIGRQLWTLFAS